MQTTYISQVTTNIIYPATRPLEQVLIAVAASILFAVLVRVYTKWKNWKP